MLLVLAVVCFSLPIVHQHDHAHAGSHPVQHSSHHTGGHDHEPHQHHEHDHFHHQSGDHPIAKSGARPDLSPLTDVVTVEYPAQLSTSISLKVTRVKRPPGRDGPQAVPLTVYLSSQLPSRAPPVSC